MCHGVGPSSEPRRWTPHTPTPNTLTEKPVEISTIEVERREAQQRVEAEVALDAERVEAEERLRRGADLHGVGRDREVGLDANPRVALVDQRQRDAGSATGTAAAARVKRGWKPPTDSTKLGLSLKSISSPISPSRVMNRMRDS